MALTKRKDLTFVKGKGYVSNSKLKDNNNSNTLKFSSIDYKTGKVTTKDSGIKISSGSSKRSSGSDIIIKETNSKTGVTTTTGLTSKGELQNKVVKNSQGKILSSVRANTQLQKQFNRAGLGFLSHAYSDNQLRKIQQNINNQQKIRLLQIDNRRDLNAIQKEIKKREIIGTTSGNFGKTVSTLKSKKTKDLAELIKISPSEAIAKKVLNGESLTPAQQNKFIKYSESKAKDLTRAQLSILKNIPKNVGLGVWEVGKETVVFSYSVLKGAYNLGYKAGYNPKKFANDTKTLFVKGSLALGKVSGYVIKNPKKSAAIVGVAVSMGLKSSVNSFAKNPVKSLTKALTYIYGGRALTKLPGVKQVRTFLNAEKYSTNSYKVKGNLVTGEIKINGVSKGKLNNGKRFTSDYSLKFNDKSKTITGTIKTKVGKKTYTQKVSLKDEGTYYLDKKTKQRISKVKSPINNRKITIKERKITPNDSSLVLVGKISAFKGEADILTTITKITNKLRTTTIKNSKGLKIINAKTKKTIKSIVKDISVTTKTKRARLPKPLTKTQISQLERFLKSIDYDKVLLGGLDKRKRLAIALGLRNDSKLLKKIEAIVDNNGNVYSYIKRSGKIEATGTLERGKIPNVKVKRKRVALRKNKKGTLSILKDNKIELLKKKKTKFQTYKSIDLPEIKFKLPLTKTNLNKYGIFAAVSRVVRKTKRLDHGLKKGNIFDMSKLNKRIKDIKQDITKINKKIQSKDVAQKKRGKLTTKSKSKAITKTIPKPKTPIKKVGGRRIITTPKLRIPPKPKIRFSFNTLKNNQVAKFEGVYRERRNKNLNYNKKSNPIVTKKVRLTTTKNRLLKRLSTKVDNSAVRSMEIKLIGVTNKVKKDISKPKILNKFRVKKGSNTKVLKLVEKSKHTIDTKGEKRELKRTRKTTTKKKTPNKTKRRVPKVKKIKKSSKIKRKSVKRSKVPKKTYRRRKK